MNTQTTIAAIIAGLALVAAFVLYLTGELDPTHAALYGALALAILFGIVRLPG